MERNSAPPAFETAAPPEALKLEEEEESLLHPQAAAATAGAEVHWDEASPVGEESENDRGREHNSGLCAMTGDAYSPAN